MHARCSPVCNLSICHTSHVLSGARSWMSAEVFSFSSETGSAFAQQTFHLLVSKVGGAGA